MTYKEAIQEIHSFARKDATPGLSRIEELCARLGHPEKSLRCVHIAGTNGKGSTAAYLTSVLLNAGYRVGTFTSPFVRTFHERIAVDGEPVSDYLLARVAETVFPHAKAMEDRPTEFEVICAIGFEVFRRKNCHFVVLESGLGGKNDPTNLIERPLLSVITGISFDHTERLGSSLSAIAAEKAGIIKDSRPVITADLPIEAAVVIEKEALRKHTTVTAAEPGQINVRTHTIGGITLDYRGTENLCTSLCGAYQPRNIALVCEIVRALEKQGIAIGENALFRGIARAKLPARFEVLQKAPLPLVVFDGGHNAEGVASAVETARALFGGKHFVLLTGVMADKAYEKMADIAAGDACEVFTVAPGVPRALPARALADIYRARGVKATPYTEIAAALAAARRRAADLDVPLLILGSLYLYKDIYRHFRQK